MIAQHFLPFGCDAFLFPLPASHFSLEIVRQKKKNSSCYKQHIAFIWLLFRIISTLLKHIFTFVRLFIHRLRVYQHHHHHHHWSWYNRDAVSVHLWYKIFVLLSSFFTILSSFHSIGRMNLNSSEEPNKKNYFVALKHTYMKSYFELHYAIMCYGHMSNAGLRLLLDRFSRAAQATFVERRRIYVFLARYILCFCDYIIQENIYFCHVMVLFLCNFSPEKMTPYLCMSEKLSFPDLIILLLLCWVINEQMVLYGHVAQSIFRTYRSVR